MSHPMQWYGSQGPTRTYCGATAPELRFLTITTMATTSASRNAPPPIPTPSAIASLFFAAASSSLGSSDTPGTYLVPALTSAVMSSAVSDWMPNSVTASCPKNPLPCARMSTSRLAVAASGLVTVLGKVSTAWAVTTAVSSSACSARISLRPRACSLSTSGSSSTIASASISAAGTSSNALALTTAIALNDTMMSGKGILMASM
mmetsp:Transcript_22149/g.56273  ORF Transcript_22149/g.56273 Transcript_22149/m.56273 type:complete len:204 (-) Transcript_22149:529-1140(-)